MAIVLIDGVEYRVAEGRSLLQAGLDQGLDIPYFCWHPAMKAVGACRLCAVKLFQNAADRKGKIVMSCMTPAKDGTICSVRDPEAAAFRRRIIELLMLNHPLDCPICDEGGECHLQDMTVMAGHVYRRYRGKKRTFWNQELGPAIAHEMNRCIECYRCVRFYREYAGGTDLGVFASRRNVYFGRLEEGTLESPFSGNLVEVCPTGVFTDKTLRRHYTRKWDMLFAPSVCVHCAAGCNTFAGSRYGSLRRILSRYHGEVNGYFLCDRGRFGYEFVESAERIRRPRATGAGEISAAEAERRLGELAAGGRLAVVGSPRASLEANFLARRLAGEGRYSSGLTAAEQETARALVEAAATPHVRLAAMKELESADVVLVLGADTLGEAPMAALALHRARAAGARLFVAAPWGTWLDEGATLLRAAPARIGAAGAAIFAALAPAGSPGAAEPPGLDAEAGDFARAAAAALREAQRPLVVTGHALGSPRLTALAGSLAWAAGVARGRPCAFFASLPECNTLGAFLLGGLPLEALLEQVAAGEVDHLLVVENDLLSRPGIAARFGEALGRLQTLAVLEHTAGETSRRATLLVPTATFAESSGTLVSCEGRAQRFFRAVPPREAEALDAVAHLALLAGRAGQPVREGEDELRELIAAELPLFAPLRELAPPAGFRVHGQPVARASHRESGRTSMPILQEIARRHPRPPDDPASPLSWSGEGAHVDVPPALNPLYWTPGWNSNEALNKFQAGVGGLLRGGDPGRRLLEPEAGGEPPWRGEAVAGPSRGDGEALLLLLARPQVFGGEELSRLAPAVRARAPEAHLALSPADAGRLGLAAGDRVSVPYPGGELELPVLLDAGLAPGLAVYPAGGESTRVLEGAARAVKVEKVQGEAKR